MESFYGGRQGVSFVLVKRFDGINIPQDGEPVYTNGYYAYNTEEQSFLSPLIERDGLNFKDYIWVKHEKNGEGDFPLVHAQGMVQCFEQGGATASTVNYGEYVIVDTVTGLNSPGHPDNGKIFKRGFNYDYDAETNKYAGGEFVGQVAGAKGDTSDIKMGSVPEVEAMPAYLTGDYTPDGEDGGLIPGLEIDGETRTYNDNIHYAWATITDEGGNIVGTRLGFTFPYNVTEMDAESVDAYYNRDSEEADFKNLNLVDRVDDKAHPFYDKWKISVPKGIKGNSYTNLRVTGLDEEEFPLNSLVCRETSYDKSGEGESTEKILGHYNTIENVSLDPNGLLSIKLSYDGQVDLDEKIRWIELNENEDGSMTEGLDLAEDGTVTVTYNTLDAAGDFQVQKFNTVLTWIKSINLSSEGSFDVTYNNDEIGGSEIYHADLRWVTSCELDDDGTVRFFYNDNSVAALFPGAIKTFKDVYINTTDVTMIEGTGDQRMHIKYNTAEEEVVGEPINYIMESVVTVFDPLVPETPIYHLLVLYSDPIYREKLKTEGKCVSYYSQKLKDEDGNFVLRDDWCDLGYVRGGEGGLHVIGDLDDVSELDDAIPPEEMPGNAPHMAGWGYTIDQGEIYVYDYQKKVWFSIGTIDTKTALPDRILFQSDEDLATHEPIDDNYVNENGFWLVTEEIKNIN